MALVTNNQTFSLHTTDVENTEAVKKVIVFDIGGVLALYSENQIRSKIFKEVAKKHGVLKTIASLFSQRKDLSERLRENIMFIVEQIGATYTNYPIIYNEMSHPHPRGLCLLHAGLISSEQFTNEAMEIIEELWKSEESIAMPQKLRRIRSSVEKTFIEKAIQKIGDGELIARMFGPCREGIAILQKALQTPGVEVMILSNYPADQFEALLKQPFMQEALQGVAREHIFCSGQLLPANDRYGLPSRRLEPKPQASAFAEISLFCHDTWGIQPQDIIFIDNQAENIVASRAMGIDGLLVNSSSDLTETTIHSCSFEELDNIIERRLQLAQLCNGITYHTNNLASLINSIIQSKAYTHGSAA